MVIFAEIPVLSGTFLQTPPIQITPPHVVFRNLMQIDVPLRYNFRLHCSNEFVGRHRHSHSCKYRLYKQLILT